MQSRPPAPAPAPAPAVVPRAAYTVTSWDQWRHTRGEIERGGSVPGIVEVSLPSGNLDWPISLSEIPNVDLVIRGAGSDTVLREAITVRGAASVEIRDLRFGEFEEPLDALTLSATQSIVLRNVAFLDQFGTKVTTGRGVVPRDCVAALTVDKAGTIALSDVTLFGARGAWSAFRMVAPGGSVTLTRTLVAGNDRPAFFVGIADRITIEDSVLVAAPGTSLFDTVWPPGGVTLRRTTLVADTPSLVHPGNNPQAPSSRWMPAFLRDSTLYVRTDRDGDGPGVTPEGAAIRRAPDTTPDLAALRARAEALAPVDRAVIAPLLGLPKP